MLFAVLSDWITTLSLIFGGCCSNAITLEQLTSQYPHAGSLITFFQFFIISLHGLPKHITWTRYGPRFKPRKIPLVPYLVQVALFYLISLLNNAAFGYQIPMAVHIIFRSGGLIVSMVLGWLVSGKKYNPTQIVSVLLVTFGVILTTLSASKPASKGSAASASATELNPHTYLKGIGILSLALLFSGCLGLVQDWTYTKFGRPPPPTSSRSASKVPQITISEPSKSPAPAPSAPPSRVQTPNTEPTKKAPATAKDPPAWQESMFYLHFLALPMFLPLFPDLSSQFASINASARSTCSLPLQPSLHAALSIPPPFSLPFFRSSPSPFTNTTTSPPFISLSKFALPTHPTLTLSLPAAYLPLLLNTLTQLLCVAGVHRLTTRVTNLTVTLVLVVRKAVSLVLSVLGAGVLWGGGRKRQGDVDQRMMWAGAGLVLLGTVGYSLGSTGKGKKEKTKAKKE